MAEIETVLVRDFPSLETPTNNRKNAAKSLNTSSSASTYVETPMADDDSPDSLRVRALCTEGKKATDILRDLETPPRNNHRKSFLSKMTEEFPSPAVANGVLSPSMSEVSAPSTFKEHHRSFASPNVSEIDLSTSQASIKPNLLFREKETKRAMDFSTVLKSREAPVQNSTAAYLSVTPDAGCEKKPLTCEARQLPETPESQPGRIVPHSHVRDDESWCASSVCPFDCMEDYGHNSTPSPTKGTEWKEKKKKGFFRLFKRNSFAKCAIPYSEPEIQQPDRANNSDEAIKAQSDPSNWQGRVTMDKMIKFLGFLSKNEQLKERGIHEDSSRKTPQPRAIGIIIDRESNKSANFAGSRESVDLEGGEAVDSEFAESLSKGTDSKECPVDESTAMKSASRGFGSRETKKSLGEPEGLTSGEIKDIPDLDDTVAPSRSYEDDEENSRPHRTEQTRRYAKRFVLFIFVPILILSIIILTSILVKRMTDRETLLPATSQTLAPTNSFDFGREQTQSPIDVPPFFDNSYELCDRAQQLTTTSVTYDSMSNVAWDNTINSCGDSLEFGFASWYSVKVADSTFMEASTCNAADFDTQITVMSGDCEGLSCVTFSDNECGAQSRAKWYAEKGKSYFVVVSGYREEWGEYTLSLNPTTINDKCYESDPLLIMGSSVFGTTSGATSEDLPSCGDVDTTKPGVWYEVSDLDGSVSADVIGRSLNFAGQVSVYDGSCEALSCTAGSKSGSITWDAVAGSRYHIYVNGLPVDGDFDLSIGRDNKESCNKASPLQPSNFAYSSSTRDAREQDVESCGFNERPHSAPGKWFSVIGTGSEFKVSTCSTDTDLDTEISLFKGTCGSLQCVAGTGRALPCGDGGAISWKSEPDSMYFIYVSGRGSRVGDFLLTLDETDSVGSLCTEPVALGTFSTRSVEGSTDVGSSETAPVGVSIGTARGVWYELLGTGNLVEVSVCGMNNGFDARVSVSTGDCSDQAFFGQSSKCGEGSDTVKFVSTIGHKYQVFVHGKDEESTGDYTLRIKHYDELNDRCALALPLETVTGIYSGSTTNAMISDAVDAKNTVASTPTMSASIPPVPSDVVGPANAPTRRPTATPTNTPSTLPSETPKKGGKDKKDKEKENKNNKDDRKLQEIVDSCNFIPPTHGLWYKIDGSGGDIIVSTCSDDTTFDTAIDIFTGGCGGLQCIVSNNDGCGSQSLVRFASQIGVAYYIQVRGIDESAVGDFSLSVTVRNPNFRE